MDMPKGVRQAVIAVWITIAVSALVTTVDKRMGEISQNLFIGYLLLYGLVCIIPYKLSKGSNVTRYIYSIITVIGYLTMLGGVTDDITKLDVVISILLIPVYAFSIWKLYAGDASNWFENKRPPALPNTH